jgi:WD40 repeat protein
MKSKRAIGIPRPALRKRGPIATTLAMGLIIGSLRFAAAQGSPDIVWQGQHSGYVRYTTFSPDGQQLASGGDDKKNNLWQASDGVLTRTIVQCSGLHCGGPLFGFYSPDGQQLATSGIKFWNVADGTLARTVGIGGIVALSRDWQYVASSVSSGGAYGTQTRSISLFKSDGTQLWQNTNAGGGATVFLPDGQSLASIGFQGIDILRVSDGSLIRNILGPRGGNLVVSPDGQFLATNGGAGGSFQWDDTIKIYRVSDGALVRTLSGTGVVTSIAFTPDSQTLIASSYDNNYDPVNGYVPSTGSIRFWRISDGALFKTYDQNTGTSANALSVSSDGQLFSYSHDSTVFVARIPSSSCASSISPGSANYPTEGGSGVVNITAPAGCHWNAVSRASWITINGPSSGTGNGVISYTARGGSSSMTGLLIVAEQTFPIRLGSDPCTYTLSPTSADWSPAGGSGGMGVQTPGGCGWTASSNNDWLAITKISRDNGGGGVTYSVAPNPGPARTGTLTVAGKTFTINQVTSACTYTVTPTDQNFGSSGGSVNIDIQTTNGCAWNAASDSTWLTVPPNANSGSGPGMITVSAVANQTTAPRIGHVNIAGQIVTITQDGVSCHYTISPRNRSFTAEGGSAFVNMAAEDVCSWSAVASDSWITITSGATGSGYGTIYYSVSPNTTGASRTGTLTIAGQTFRIDQTAEAQGAPDILWTGVGHTAQVNAVAFSPDGQLLASASSDHTVKLWRVADGALVATLDDLLNPSGTTHQDVVNTVAFSHDGTMVASGSMDRHIKLWRVSDGALLRTMGGREFILGVAFTPDDQVLASGGGYSTNDIKIWRLSDGQNISIINDNLGANNAVAYSPDGQLLAAAKANAEVTVFNPSNGNAVQNLGHDGTVNFVAFSPDGQMLATASDDQSARLWPVGNNFAMFTLNGPSGFVKSVGFTPDHQILIAAGQDWGAQRGTILFWRTANGALVRGYNQETSTGVFSAQFSPDGSAFAYGLADGRVILARNSIAPGPPPPPTPTPSPTATAAPTPTPTPAPSATPTATATATPTPTATSEPSPTATATATSTPTATPIATVAPTPTATPEPRATPTATPESSASPTSTVEPTPSASSSPTATATATAEPSSAPPSRPLNIATRGHVETGDNAMIGGFIITGNEAKKVVVRAIGPSLQKTLPGALADPVLELRAADGSLIAQNDNWQDDAVSAAELAANQIAPSHDLESAIVATLEPGTYTATVRGNNGSSGIGLVELYDLSRTVDSKLANISTRGIASSEADVLIGGFILGGANGNARVLVRAIGPSLAKAGVVKPLPDPTLELRDGNGELLLANDNWRDQQQSAIEQTGIPPNDSSESAILADLAPGAYTAIVAGKSGAAGTALIEVYNLH